MAPAWLRVHHSVSSGPAVMSEGMLPAGGTAAEFRSLIATEIKNWKETARVADIKPE